MTAWGYTCLSKVTSQWLAHLSRVNCAESNLNSLVAVRFLVLYSCYNVGVYFHQSYWNEETVLIPNLRHAELLTQQCLAIVLRYHFSPPYSLISMFTSAGKSRRIKESTAFGVGSTMSIRRLCVRISKCSRESLYL